MHGVELTLHLRSMTMNAFLVWCTYIKSITQRSSTRNAVSCVLLHLQTSFVTRSVTMGFVEGQGSSRSITHILAISQSQCHFPPNYKSKYRSGRDTELICLVVLPSPVMEKMNSQCCQSLKKYRDQCCKLK